MKIEMKTTSLKEIIKKCDSLDWNIEDVKIEYKICEDIRKPDDYFVKLFLINSKK